MFVILTNSSAEGLSLGALITTTEEEEHLSTGFSMIKGLLHPEKAFGGRGLRGPSIIITDDSATEQNALKTKFSRKYPTVVSCWL